MLEVFYTDVASNIFVDSENISFDVSSTFSDSIISSATLRSVPIFAFYISEIFCSDAASLTFTLNDCVISGIGLLI